MTSVAINRAAVGGAAALRGGSLPRTPLVASAGVAVVVAVLVGSTPIGSGDYGQWLMVSRAFGGESTPAYRVLADVPPLVPWLIAAVHGWVGDPILALHAVAIAIVVGLGLAFHAVGSVLGQRPVIGLLSTVLGLLVTDRFLELLAFGGLLQAAALAFLLAAVAAFSRALDPPAGARRWWVLGIAGLFATCLTHVPTASVGLPVGLAAALLAVVPSQGEPSWRRLRAAWPLLVGFAGIGLYWLFVIGPASLGYVRNPASLAYRGPERVLDLLTTFPPTAFVVAAGAITLAAWAGRQVVARRLPRRAGRPLILAAWLAASWGAFLASTVGAVSTDYPRFVPILLAPLVVAAAIGTAWAGAAVARRARRAATEEQALLSIGIAVTILAPFTIAGYQTEARGYELPDPRALAAAATWADARLVAGATVLAPVREAKWVEGLTGRSTLFSSQVRYAFRPMEWARSLAADALFRGNLSLVNESFLLTMTDGAPSGTGQQPRAILIGANHGGEYLDLLRLVPASSLILDPAGRTLASLPALAPAGFGRVSGPDRVAAISHWSGTRRDTPVRLVQTVALERGTSTFELDQRVVTGLPIGGLQLELRPAAGVTLTQVQPSDDAVELTFGQIGRTDPRLRLEAPGGTIRLAPGGGLVVNAPGASLALRVSDLTAGGASASVHLLDPAAVVEEYAIGGVILRRDPAYEARRDRLELLGFHVARAEGPYIVMVRTGSARPAPLSASP